MDMLRVRFKPDDQWHGELEISASAGGFSGTGKAWFSTDELRLFASAIIAFPLPADLPPTITGGLGGNDKSPPQELVALTFEPHNAVGAVRATVHLATERWNGKERDLVNDITMRFLVSYGDLATFGPAMLDAIDGRADKAVLTATL